MTTAKLFVNGRSQAVRLPKEFQFAGKDVLIQKVGSAVIMYPHEKKLVIFMQGVNGFSDDVFSSGREQEKSQEREDF